MTEQRELPSSEEVDAFLRGAIELEAEIFAGGSAVREASKVAYGTALLDGRLAMLAVIARLLSLRPPKSLEPTPDKSEALGLIAAFVQGTYATETLVSEGHTSKPPRP